MQVIPIIIVIVIVTAFPALPAALAVAADLVTGHDIRTAAIAPSAVRCGKPRTRAIITVHFLPHHKAAPGQNPFR
jgi:hypothetical protein